MLTFPKGSADMTNRTRLEEARAHLARAHLALTSVYTGVNLAVETNAMREVSQDNRVTIENSWRIDLELVAIEVNAARMLLGGVKK